MLTKFQIYIILAPFLATLILGFLFLFFQVISNKKYLFNLFISFFLIFFLFLFFVYKLSYNLTDQQIFYLIFAFLCNSYIFMNLIQVPISSIQLTILRIVYLNPKITKKQIIQKYNASQIFEERLARLKAGDIIFKNKSHFFLKNKKILLLLSFFLILKKIFNIKN
tara:strand:+ start:237 stop:734 length:498 start_codon:yes stop_codon:yes gene_type:complete